MNERSYDDIKNKHKLLKMFPFNSETKKMTVVVELEHQKRVRVYTKGASENILEDCINTIDENGQVSPFEQSKKDFIRDTIIKRMA
jgi:magnesium-transporting ATPase (P-type)